MGGGNESKNTYLTPTYNDYHDDAGPLGPALPSMKNFKKRWVA
jgi:hypothetical protein